MEIKNNQRPGNAIRRTLTAFGIEWEEPYIFKELE